MQVCLLPLTPETEHIINAELLSWLPKVQILNEPAVCAAGTAM
jgi:phosphoglycerate dehydrogenase-like enzyme